MAEVNKEVLGTDAPSNDYTGEQKKTPRAIPSPKKTQESEKKKKRRAKEKQPSLGQQISNNFASVDHEEIRKRLLFDWFFPEVISTIDDILRMIFFGDRNGGRRRSRSDRGGYTSYASRYDDSPSRNRDREIRNPTRQNFRRIRLEFYEREDAEEVLDELRENLAESGSGFVTVKELYSLSDLPTDSTMYKWGWFDLEEATIERDGDNYILEMPRAEVIR